MSPRNPFWPRHAAVFKLGGSRSSAPVAAPAQTTIASTPPPPTTQSVEVQQAQREARKQAAKRRGLDSTILAGETGGYTPPQTALGASSAATAGAVKGTLLSGA